MQLVFDIETNGLLPELDTVHCISLIDAESGEAFSFEPAEVSKGVAMLEDADAVIGHNIIGFDLPALRKVFPKFKLKDGCVVRDTIICTALIWTGDLLKDRDFRLQKKGKLHAKLIGRQSLEAWGYRIGEHKVGTDITDWSTWTPYMGERCAQDTAVTAKLWKLIQAQNYSEEAIQLEHDVTVVIQRQERRGFAFDVEKAKKLYTKLLKRSHEVDAELQKVFPPWWQKGETFTPKRDNKTRGYVAGVPFTKVELVTFNPGSRDHVASRLKAIHGWRPKDFTNDGKPKVDESVLGDLQYPEAKLLSEFFLLQKRLGALGDGRQAWLKKEQGGRIHGRVHINGAVTGRMTHASPNLAQVPANEAPYGKDCRELFVPGKGMVLLGIDASGLELRDLAGYMARWDGGEYIKTVIEGDKDAGTDIHSVNCKALGMGPNEIYVFHGKRDSGRQWAKRWFYAFIYGAGDYKLGLILGATGARGKIAGVGKAARERMMSNVPALGRLVKLCKKRAKTRKFLNGLDGRKLHVRHEHAALNTLLQSCGAIQMKKALVIFDADLQASGYIPGRDYEFVANVHDEWQIEIKDIGLTDVIGTKGVKAIKEAGETFDFPCPLGGDFKAGRSWAETH